MAFDVAETAHQGFSIKSLKFIEVGAINDAGNDFSCVIRYSRVCRHYAIKFFNIVSRCCIIISADKDFSVI